MQELCSACHSFLNFLFPLKCPGCDVRLPPDRIVCMECLTALEREFNPGRIQVDGHEASYAYPYDGTVRKMIISYKFRGKFKLAPLMAGIFKRMLGEEEKETLLAGIPPFCGAGNPEQDHLSPILALLAASGYQVRPLLLKTRRTERQVRLGRSQRLTNPAGAFRLNPAESLPEKRRIIIIDDVITTGGTLRAACESFPGWDIRGLMLAHGETDGRM
ncbi:MAG: phosphoribosyltransferase family protein [Candidatus Wallbacteria bacterium]|nr:phosphoribosyltransferase family protein [Candidatus Wallbacteria bacterium]